MRAQVKFVDKPYPRTPDGTGRQVYEGEYESGVLWCKTKPCPEAPTGRYGIHVASRAVIFPLEEAVREPGKSRKDEVRA